MNEANKFGKDTRTRYNLRNMEDAYKAIEKLERDPMTGVYHKHVFLAKLDEMLEASRVQAVPVALLFCDGDGIKAINDTYNHSIGDRAITYQAKVISRKVRARPHNPTNELRHNHYDGANDLVGRLKEEAVEIGRVGSGDEFGVMLYGVNAEQAYQIAERVRTAFCKRQYANLKGNNVKLTVSIGVATTETSKTGVFDGPSKSRIDFEETAATRDDLYKCADEALKWAKLDGRNRTRIYSRGESSRRAGESVGSAHTHKFQVNDILVADVV